MLVRRNHPSKISLRLAPHAQLLAIGMLAAFGSASLHAQTGSFASQSLNLGSLAVNATTPATATLTFTFSADGTIAAPAVVTQGAKNLDFTDAGTGTCTTNGTSHTYNAGDGCTVDVKFTPKYAGTRYGAVVLDDSTGAPIATEYLYGTATGPQVVFSPSARKTFLGAGLTESGDALAVDSAGNVYVGGRPLKNVHPVRTMVYKIPGDCASSACITTLDGGFSSISGIAVDGAGNLYVAEPFTYGNGLLEMPAGCNSSSCVLALGGGFGELNGVAVDGSGNVYTIDSYGMLYEIPPGCISSACVKVLMTDATGTLSAVDGSGNFYITGSIGNIPALLNLPVAEIPAGCTSISCWKGLGAYSISSWGLTLDATGNIYFSMEDSGGGRLGGIYEMPPDCASASCVTQLFTRTKKIDLQTFGVAVDSAGNVYFNDEIHGGNLVLKMERANPPTLTFASIAGGNSSPPRTVTAQNIGNQPLTFPVPSSGNNPSLSGNFILDSSGANACPLLSDGSGSAGMLAVGASCELDITFTPPGGSNGPMVGSLALTDDTLNAPAPAYATQTLLLSEPGTTKLVGSLDAAVDATTRSTTVAQADNLRISGWAADVPYTNPVTQVTILIDGLPAGSAALGIASPDVAIHYNDVAYYNSGWSFLYPAASLPVGTHTASAIAYDSFGISTPLQTRTFTVSATPVYGPPFGSIDGAVDATTRSTTIAQSDNLQVSGWAADVHDGAPVSKVSILIDGNPAGNATLGIASPNVAAAEKNPAYLNSGWILSMSASGLALGTHSVSAVATDSLALSAMLGTKTITVSTTPVDGPPFGSLDKAVDATSDGTTVSQADNLFVGGWAADVHDGAPVHQVSIFIDGAAVGNATLGFARPDVAKKNGSAYLNSGWQFTLPASSLAAGQHLVTAVATDSLGQSTQFQIAVITVTP